MSNPATNPEATSREMAFLFIFVFASLGVISWLAHKTCEPKVVAYSFTDGEEPLYKMGDDLFTYTELFDKHGCTP